MHQPDDRVTRIDRGALGLVVAALPFRLLLALGTDLSPDEAYYLSVQRHALPFYDHPPLTPWLAGLLDNLPIPLELRVRAPALLLGTMAGLMILIWVKQQGGDRHAQRWAALLGSWLALPLAAGFLMTPDVPMLTATLSLALLHTRIRSMDESAYIDLKRCVWITVVCWVGMLAKVSMLLPVICFVAASKKRACLSASVAAMVGVVIALPLCWNSLFFQLDHAFAPNPNHGALLASLGAVTAAFGAQLALWGPSLVIGFKRAMKPSFERNLIVAMTALVALSALIRAIAPEPNWYAPAAIAFIAGASHTMHIATRWRRITTVLVGPVLALAFATHVLVPWMPLPIHVDPSARLHGWSEETFSVHAPQNAPGVGKYGTASEACIYHSKCKKIYKIQMDKIKTSSFD
ncbi:MAG: hypothetical protein CSA75_00340 [Sorangium cellulosum]|nr:MAG: hypothetical protein CSA75_00340 [Sorangium cellulosum]